MTGRDATEAGPADVLGGELEVRGALVGYAYDPVTARMFLGADRPTTLAQAVAARPAATPLTAVEDTAAQAMAGMQTATGNQTIGATDSGMPEWSLAVHLNHSCNLGCVYCYADGRTSDGSGTDKGAYGGQRTRLPPQVLAVGVQKFFRDAPAATANVVFLGGEPLLSRSRFVQAVQIVREAAERTGTAVRFEVTTNGTRLPSQVLDVLRKHRFQVSISVDGRPATHDAQRPLLSGQGSYARVRTGLEQLRAAGIPYAVRMTALRDRPGFATDHLALLDLGGTSVGAQFSTYADDGWRPLDPAQAADLLSHYESVAFAVADGDERARRVGTVAKVVAALTRRSRNDHQCGAGRRYFALTPTGDVFPCHRFAGMTRYTLGNVLDNGFGFRPVELFVRRGLAARIEATDRSGCRSCFARNVCAGGCPQLAAPCGGDLDRMPPFYCQEMRLRVHGAIRGLVRHALGDTAPGVDPTGPAPATVVQHLSGAPAAAPSR